jgi:hypothetical protein
MTNLQRLQVIFGIGSGLSPRWYVATLAPALIGLALARGLRKYADAIDTYAGDE